MFRQLFEGVLPLRGIEKLGMAGGIWGQGSFLKKLMTYNWYAINCTF